MFNIGQPTPRSDEKKKTVSQYLELECTKGNFKDCNHGGAMSKVVVYWEAKQLSNPCAVM